MMPYFLLCLTAVVLFVSACGGGNESDQAQVFQATRPLDQQNAPVFTETPTRTLTDTLTPTATLTPTPTLTLTSTLTPTATSTPRPSPTVPLHTLTPPSASGALSSFVHPTADFTTPEGWACGDFPCADDVEAMLQRIRVPQGYIVEHVGRFPGQPQQITYGSDGRLYATVLENGTRSGAVYAMNADGTSERYSATLISPLGLAFQPGTTDLYVSSRLALGPVANATGTNGGLWKIDTAGQQELILDDLPCCYQIVGGQPAGMVFGPDGYLYLAVSALTDHGEPANPMVQSIANFHPLEASILRIQPHTGEHEVFAQGLREPFDLTFDSTGQFYATDSGTLEGPVDRLLAVDRGKHYGWPFWRTRGCAVCPIRDRRVDVQPDLLRLPDYTLPRGIIAYTGTQFPQNVFDSLFVAFWNGTSNAQRIVRIVPDEIPTNEEALALYEPEPFVTGLIRPVDVTLDPEGALVIADFIYGNIWRVRYIGPDFTIPKPERTYVPEDTPDFVITRVTEPADMPPSLEPSRSIGPTRTPGSLFVTSTPRP